MTDVNLGWGSGPSAHYQTLAAEFRPIFREIAESAVVRDLDHVPPREELGKLRAAGFTSLRIPTEFGGRGITLPELFGLLIELSEADPNITNILRAHVNFVEDTLTAGPSVWRDRWIPRILAGETIGGAHSEIGSNKLGAYQTTMRPAGDGFVVSGTKYYTTGTLFASWLKTTATDEAGKAQTLFISAEAPGVRIIDDWDGFGQKVTASGTTYFEEVPVPSDALRPGNLGRYPYASSFLQLVHLASLAGIARAAAREVGAQVASRRRVYARGNATLPGEDPQILQILGQVRSAAFASGAIVLKVAEGLQRVYDHVIDPDANDETKSAAADLAELEVSQSVTVVSNLVLNATTTLFDALGASAVKQPLALDRFWRNARTITSHNPRVYHDKLVGTFAVKGKFDRVVPGVGLLPQE